MKPIFSIERTRNILLVVGFLIFLAIVAFLLSGQWRRRALLQDLPRRLGADIQLQANQFDYTQTRRGKTLFHIHAERAEQTRRSGETVLHHVRIEFYNPQGQREDTIRGDEFEYNQSAGKAVAQGAVEINVRNPANTAAASNTPSVRIRTSGLTFDQKSEIATTSQHLDFLLPQGTGSATGAIYDAAHGKLILQSNVRAQISQRGTPVAIDADHAEMERAAQVATLRNMNVRYPSGSATGGLAHILFRKDGSIDSLQASDGVRMQSADGAVAQSQQAVFQFNAKSQPASGIMSGGTQFLLHHEQQSMKASSPRATLQFDQAGVLQRVQLHDGAVMDDQETTFVNRKGTKRPTHLSREWRSQTANLRFISVPGAGRQAKSRQQLQRMDGDGGVTVTSLTSTDGELPQKSTLVADRVQAEFSAQGQLARVLGFGHADFRQINGDQKQWSSQWESTSDTLDARLMNRPETGHPTSGGKSNVDREADSGQLQSGQIQSMLQHGHVQISASRAPAHPGQSATHIHATAAQSVYDGTTEIVHLTGAPDAPPHLVGDNFAVTATAIDLDRAHQNAYAHSAVEATWLFVGNARHAPTPDATTQAPAHILAEQAAWIAETQKMTFTGNAAHPVHLWQSANSIHAPRVVLDQKLQTLDAVTESSRNPVFTVLAEASDAPATRAGKMQREPASSLLRLTSGAVHESYAEQAVVFSTGVMRNVTVVTTTPDGPATIQARQVQAFMPSGPSPHGPQGSSALTAVNRLTCSGDVLFQSPGRIGRGETLRYTSENATAVLDGTSERNPTFTDSQRGTITGRQIQFNLTDNSVRILDASGITHSGNAQKQTTQHR